MHKIFLALGTNLGNKEVNIENAIKLLKEKIEVIKVAKFYKTKPWGYADQDDFLNSALLGMTDLEPFELLTFLQETEQKIGRQKRFQNGPREIDIDILFYDDLIMDTSELIIPHSKLHERDFALKPLLDLEPSFIHPLLKTSLQNLYDANKDSRHP